MFRLWVAAVMAVFAMGVQTGTTLSSPPDSTRITIDKPVHFSAADGSDLVAAAGTYRIEQATDRTLRLIPLEGKESLVVESQATTHEESIVSPLALLGPQQEDEHHVVLLSPGGNALDASGTYSGVKTRVTNSAPLQSRLMIQDYMLARRQPISTPPSNLPPPPPNPNPDLVITSAVLVPTAPTPYDFAVLHVTVTNQGPTDAKLDSLTPSQMTANMRHLTVQLWDSAGKPGEGMGPGTHQPSADNSCRRVSGLDGVGRTLLTDVVGTLKWDLTLNSYITEANAGNNMYSMIATVRPRPAITGPAPDLALSGCSFTPLNPPNGTRFK